MVSIAHMINPFVSKKGSEYDICLPIVFESIKKAKDKDISIFCACYKEDKKTIPTSFKKTRFLKKSSLDYFKGNKRLPLIKEILDNLYESSDADYMIYTNSDIILRDDFYKITKQIVRKDYDAFIINRRTISKRYNKKKDLGNIYKERGKKHNGYDCFVFKKNIYKKFILGKTLIGTRFFGKVMYLNMAINAKKFKVFKDEKITFHIGNDREWNTKRYEDYTKHNRCEFKKILKYYQKVKKIDYKIKQDLQLTLKAKILNMILS